MEKQEVTQLQEALLAYAAANGQAAADALVIESATDADLAKLARDLMFTEAGKRRRGIGDATAATIVRRVGALLSDMCCAEERKGLVHWLTEEDYARLDGDACCAEEYANRNLYDPTEEERDAHNN